MAVVVVTTVLECIQHFAIIETCFAKLHRSLNIVPIDIFPGFIFLAIRSHRGCATSSLQCDGEHTLDELTSGFLYSVCIMAVSFHSFYV